jgi:hypothetical protein
MGIIRKSLMIGTVGVVRGSSKKQRVAKAQLTELRKQTEIVQAQARAAGVPDARPLGFHDQMRAQWGLAPKPGAQPQIEAAPPVAPPPGWYPSPQAADQVQWWDGAQWTPSFAPRR